MERDMLPWFQHEVEWTGTTTNAADGNGFNSMLDADWYMNNVPPHSDQDQLIPNIQIQTQQQNIVCPNSDPNIFPLPPSLLPPPNSNLSHLLNTNKSDGNNKNPFGNVFDLESQDNCLAPSLNFPMTRAAVGFGPMEESSFGGLLRPSNSLYSSPLLFDDKKKGIMCAGHVSETNNLGGGEGPLSISRYTSTWLKEFEKMEGKEEIRVNEGGFNDDKVVDIGNMGINNENNGGNSSNDDTDNENQVAVEGGKGKKKERPTKSLVAERRRRKKLSDRLYTLRSVVPKISKMDRASILGDAVDYMKELQQQINDLQSELEPTSHVSPLPPGFHTMKPTTSTLHVQAKGEKPCHSNVSSPTNQSTKVEVRVMDGGSFNIHMFCNNKPGILLSITRALEDLGLEVRQAVISCFNGFILDVFKAEQYREGQEVLLPEQIKAVLMNAVGFHGNGTM